MSYYLVYGTSETERQRVAHRRMVNYYLDYRTSETTPASRVRTSSVNYCLDYGPPKLMCHLCEAEGR